MMRKNTNDFSDVKIGCRLYNYIRDEYCHVIGIDDSSAYRLLVKYEDDYTDIFTADGKFHTYDVNQTLFWDKPQIIAPSKPFDLKSFLEEQLVPVEFDSSCENYCFVYNNLYNTFTVDTSQYDEYATVYFHYDNVDYVAEVLSDEQVTMEELTKVFKELGWL